MSAKLTDLELLDKICENLNFINPLLFNDAQRRGIAHYLNYLPNNVDEAKAVIRARLAKDGRYYEDEQIFRISDDIYTLKKLQKKIASANVSDVHLLIPLLKEMLEKSEEVLKLFDDI